MYTIPTLNFLLSCFLGHASAQSPYHGPKHSTKCLTGEDANLLARQIFNITSLPKEDQLPAMQVLALDNFTFTSDSTSFLTQKPLNQVLSTSIPQYLDIVNSLPHSVGYEEKIFWLGHTCDTVSVYRETYLDSPVGKLPIRGIDYMVVDPAQDYKLKEWYSEMNSGASAYAEGKVEFTKSAFPERPGGKPEVVMGGGVEKYSESACGNSNGQCLKDEEARKIMAEYGGLLKTGSMHEGVAEKLFTDDIELVSDSMSWIRTGQLHRTSIRTRKEYINKGLSALPNPGATKVLKLAWTCDTIIQYDEVVAKGKPDLTIRGFHIFSVDLQSRKIRKVFYEFNSGVAQQVMDLVAYKEHFNVVHGKEGVKYDEHSCSAK